MGKCLSVFTNAGGVILGSNTLLDVLLVFDKKNWQMGFAPSSCGDVGPYGEAFDNAPRNLAEASSTLYDTRTDMRGTDFGCEAYPLGVRCAVPFLGDLHNSSDPRIRHLVLWVTQKEATE